MPASQEPHSLASSADDRVPYDVAEAVIRTVARLSPDFTDEQSVMDAIREYKGPQFHEYLAVIARTHHSVFYEQLQELYEFARARVPSEQADEVCFQAGQEFARRLFTETPAPLEQAALAPAGSFQATFIEVIRSYMTRFTGGKYLPQVELGPEEILIRIGWREPEAVRAYLALSGCDPARALRNSLGYIAGAVEHFGARLAAGYEPERFQLEWLPEGAVIHMPVRADDHARYDALIQTFAGRIRNLEARQGESPSDPAVPGPLIASPAMRATWDRLRRAARSEELILMRGESGTGKSFLARHIHELSGRRDGPFVEVALTSDVGSDNLVQSDLFGHERGAFTGATARKQGLFSLADGGTIFLDEIGDASSELQARLLRVLEAGNFRRLGGVEDIHVDVRVIAATNRDLESAVEEGGFRQDLYFRLNVIPLHLPPLRDRVEEIGELARFLFARALAEKGGPVRELPDDLAARLCAHDWPGNVRELEHAMRHALAMSEGPFIREEDLPEPVIASLAGHGAPGRSDDDRRLAAPPVQIGESLPIIDVAALRRAIRAANPLEVSHDGGGEPDPAHVNHARRVWLETLIEECHGDLALIAQYWDRGSEKTLRNLVRSLGLSEQLAVARTKHKTRGTPR